MRKKTDKLATLSKLFLLKLIYLEKGLRVPLPSDAVIQIAADAVNAKHPVTYLNRFQKSLVQAQDPSTIHNIKAKVTEP